MARRGSTPNGVGICFRLSGKQGINGGEGKNPVFFREVLKKQILTRQSTGMEETLSSAGR